MGALALVMALAAFFRLYDLGQGHPGLAIYTSISSHAYKSFHNWLYPNMFADGSILADKPPLFFWYQGLFIELLGPSNLAFRLPVALAGICSVILLYVVVRRTAGTTPALIAAAALAIMPLDVNYARSTFIEPVTTVTLLLTAYFVVRAAQEEREGFYYAAAFVLGLAWMVKLWQGLLPAPAFAMIALMYRWQPWGDFIRTGVIGVGIFLATAFWWPVVVWLTPSAYESVMHADSVWDMIFGWNLRERFGDLEYGARHRQDILWFVTGPMAPYFGVSLFPAAAVGVVAVAVALWHKAVAKIGSLKPVIALRESRVWAYLSFYTDETGMQTRSRDMKDAEDSVSRVTEMGILWVLWFGLAVVAFGGANIRLITYWVAATPAVAALTGIGIVAIPTLLARGGLARWLAYLVALSGSLYCAVVYGRTSHVFGINAGLSAAIAIAVVAGGILLYFQWRPFGKNVVPAIAVTALAVLTLLTSAITLNNLFNPRDDTLGRIGFDMIPARQLPRSEPSEREIELQRQGGMITAIVRVELEDIDAAIEYVRQRRGDSRYLLASDSYNTGAFISMRTGEPVLPVYSEYRLDNLVDRSELKRMIEDGDIPFFLTVSYLEGFDFLLYALMSSNSRDVTARAGLPARGEYQLFEVIR
jgi:4-amino-4-deoxy-L-arabinose transferase-like glycosyltransferase